MEIFDKSKQDIPQIVLEARRKIDRLNRKALIVSTILFALQLILAHISDWELRNTICVALNGLIALFWGVKYWTKFNKAYPHKLVRTTSQKEREFKKLISEYKNKKP